jgi:hypothetical protein
MGTNTQLNLISNVIDPTELRGCTLSPNRSLEVLEAHRPRGAGPSSGHDDGGCQMISENVEV